MPDADTRLTDAHDIALAALHEITPASTVGPPAGYLIEDDGSVSLRFENRLPGYPGWYWTVTVARVEDAEPTVLEVELLPADGALLAPEWVPWAERLAEYRAHQAELAEQAAAVETGESGDSESASDDTESDGSESENAKSDNSDEDNSDENADDDLGDDDGLDEDEDSSQLRVLHAGDLDGVDIDELDDSAVEDDSEPDDSEPDDSEPDDSAAEEE